MATATPSPWQAVGKVRSFSQPGKKVYVVSFRADTGALRCQCGAFIFGGGAPCKHIELVARARLFLVTE